MKCVMASNSYLDSQMQLSQLTMILNPAATI